jgi:hypothetical protein
MLSERKKHHEYAREYQAEHEEAAGKVPVPVNSLVRRVGPRASGRRGALSATDNVLGLLELGS